MASVTTLLRTALDMRQSEYYRHYLLDPESLTGREYSVMEFMQACLGKSRKAIEHLMDRTDGPLATPVEIIYPKVFYKYPYAVSQHTDSLPAPDIDLTPEIITPKDTSEPYSNESPLTSLRETIKRLSEETVKLRNDILDTYEINQHALSMGGAISPDLMMRSVVAANFLKLSSSPSGAMSLFDQIDGKIATVFQALGGDVYLLDASTEAPANATWSKEHNCYVLEATNATNMWTDALKLMESIK